MPSKSPVFEQTTRRYLKEVFALDFTLIERNLCLKKKERDEITVPLFGIPHQISPTGVLAPSGYPADFNRSVIIFKYLLLCPAVCPREVEWVTYRNLKNSGPLTKYFENEVERALSSCFSGRLEDLKAATHRLGGLPPSLGVSYDHAAMWDALPKVPVMLLFNDADETFPASASVLFKDSAESYLDPECLAMVGRLLFTLLSGN